MSAFSLVGLSGLPWLTACGTSGGSVAATTGTGGLGTGGTDTGTVDTGTSVCDGSSVKCVDLADAGNASTLGSAGDYGFLSIEGDTLIVINLGDGSFDVLSAICTHAGCQVSYRRSQDDIICRCHNSYFDMDGVVTGGPAPRPLKKYDNEIQNDTLVIYL